jgi:DNA modification methylase
MDKDGKVDQAFQEMRRRRKRQEIAKQAAVAPPLDATACRVIHGDNLAAMRNLDAAGERFPLIFTDPQYNIGEDYGEGPQGDWLPECEYLEQQRQRLAAAAQLLTPDGSLWVLIDVFHSADFVLILRELGLHQRAYITWYETFGTYNSTQTNCSRTSRHLLYFVKDPKRFIFHPEAVSCRSARQELGDKRANPWGKVFDDVWTIPRLFGTSSERIPDFPTQLPLDLLRPIVGCATRPGDAVLDFNSGSATTGAACLELGRRFVGIEKRARFVKLATDRLKCIRK